MSYSTHLRTIRPHHTVFFGADGNDTAFLGQGWCQARLRCRWTKGDISDVLLIHPGNRDLFLEIDAFPLTWDWGDKVPAQRIEVLANGTSVGTIDFTEQQRVALHIGPNRVPPDRILTLSVVHLGASGAKHIASSRDNRRRGVCFLRLSLFTVQGAPSRRYVGKGGISAGEFADRTGLPLDAALACFHGLGEAAEFSLVKARAGLKTIDLAHSVALALPDLLRGRDSAFPGFGEAMSFDVNQYPQGAWEYEVVNRTYGAKSHKTSTADSIGMADFITQNEARLLELRTALRQILVEGEKVFVLLPGPSGEVLTEQDVLPLLIALNRHSPNRLLWISVADADNPPGTVQQTAPFLLRGWIDRLQPDGHAHDILIDVWLEVCANALAIIQAEADERTADFGPPKHEASQALSSDEENERLDMQRWFKVESGRYIGLEENFRQRTLLDSRSRDPAMRSLLQDAEISDLQLVARVKGRGETISRRESPYSNDLWAGYRGSRIALEGFAIIDRGDIPENAVTYQVLQADNTLSQLSSVGEYACARKKNDEMFGFIVSINEKFRHAMEILYEATFVDGEQSERCNSGTICKGSAGAAVEAIRILILDKIGYIGDTNWKNWFED